MQKITTQLWYDKEAKEAADFYAATFPAANTKIRSNYTIRNTPSGDCDIVNMDIYGLSFLLFSAGPVFKFNPTVSFMIFCDSAEEVEELYGKLAEGGSPLMALGEYPFSKKYGWIEDKYGLSWQIILMDQPPEHKLVPTMMFVGDSTGKAEDAINFYVSVFKDASIGAITCYGEGEKPDDASKIAHARFTLEGQEFAATDGGRVHKFKGFNEAISFIIECDNQAEIDYYWEKLSAVPESEVCGWLKDKFGFSWQVQPKIMYEMMESGDQKKIDNVTQYFLKIKKFNIADLQKAYDKE